MLVNEATELAVGLARRFEGFRPIPYLDPVGIATVGYGFTRYASGKAVTLRDPVLLLAPAEELLGILMARTARAVAIRLAATPAVSTERHAALADFAYNLGLSRLLASNLWQFAVAGRWDACPAEFRKWRLAGGKILPGLVLRREAEIALLD